LIFSPTCSRYKDKTIGVIVLQGNTQQNTIHNLLQEKIDSKDYQERIHFVTSIDNVIINFHFKPTSERIGWLRFFTIPPLKTDGILHPDSKDKANILNKQFQTLTISLYFAIKKKSIDDHVHFH
jgi:hypothetical protein